MMQPDKNTRHQKVERRKHWRDRRCTPERRSPERLQRMEYECRSGIPRRKSDLADVLTEGEVWWEEDVNYI